jgi:hypothetical protein
MSVSLTKTKAFAIVGIVVSLTLAGCGGRSTTAPDTVQEPDSAQELEATSPTGIQVTEMEEFISMTEFFSVKVPAGWSTEEAFPGGAFLMANSEAALERHKSGSAVESGDLVLNIGFLPYRFLETNELGSLNIQFEATPDVFLQSILPIFHVTSDAAISDAELVSLSDERDAGMLTVLDDKRDGMILMFVAGDGVIAVVSAVGFLGEMSELEEITYAVAADVVFSGDQDALYGALLGG